MFLIRAELQPTISFFKAKTSELSRKFVDLNAVATFRELSAEGYEKSLPIFWWFFESTFALLLAWFIERKSVNLVLEHNSQEDMVAWRKLDADQRRQMMQRYRRNFGRRKLKEIFELQTSFFNKNSPLLQHFCQNIANAPALDDVYNAVGTFNFHGMVVLPMSAAPDPWSTFYLSCPNAQAVRNRYRLVSRLIEQKEARSLLSIACGSAQPLLHAAYELDQRGIELSIVLTDAERVPLDLARRRAEQAGVHDQVSYIQASFDKITEQLGDRRFEVVEACGILDYLEDDMAIQLIQVAMSHLQDDGVLILANMNATRGADLLRRIYNWEIRYRTPQELAQLIHRAGGKSINIFSEPWGIHTVATTTR